MDDSDVRWLQTQFGALQRRQRRERIPVEGVSGSAMRVLGAIARRADGAQPGELAAELSMTSSNVAAALGQLDTAGFVSRTRDATDTRRVNLALTDAGRAFVARNRAARDLWLGEAVEALLDADEQALLLRAAALLGRLARFEPPAGRAEVRP